ncbi:DUF1492 domain-containing protein [uncultured Streptococcus sp.]|uniref:DUF1492 domain-containing protein n=1 Tax=uncultured Streptococcus sp. TaxID=83427 RepID=UPI0027DDB9CB|nr:DUF1492 domain-containing protein [uncultured Streptococcus sp.]
MMSAKTKELEQRLKRIRKLDKEIKGLDLEIQYLDDGLFARSTLTTTKVKGGTRADTADRYNKQIERKEELRQKIDRLLAERAEIADLIDLLDDPIHRMVLRLFFINGMRVDEVGEVLGGYSDSQVFYFRRKGLDSLAKLV